MSRDWCQDLTEFHAAMCPEQIGDHPLFPSSDVIDLRIRLMDEELSETITAIDDKNLVEVADGLADLIYVAIGTAVAFGIDLRPVWDEVHGSNMAKAGGEKREDGKRLKPPGWTPPDIALILNQQTKRWEASQGPVCQGHGERAEGSPKKCCDRAGEYNGFGSDGPLAFRCPESCSCHD
ncbi:hypothetical protein V5E97_06600 [Singulisphaera sp. Ch08]|uniref:HAD family hydrolase n=1 Tax=Singulisphaera sp. Ch08 TaxID=3120278 RepID=A0AAU7CL74_9BACT